MDANTANKEREYLIHFTFLDEATDSDVTINFKGSTLEEELSNEELEKRALRGLRYLVEQEPIDFKIELIAPKLQSGLCPPMLSCIDKTHC